MVWWIIGTMPWAQLADVDGSTLHLRYDLLGGSLDPIQCRNSAKPRYNQSASDMDI